MISLDGDKLVTNQQRTLRKYRGSRERSVTCTPSCAKTYKSQVLPASHAQLGADLYYCKEAATAQLDVCLVGIDTGVLLIAQEDKTRKSSQDPVDQLMVEAIATYQASNKLRASRSLPPLLTMNIPCIIMSGTQSEFCCHNRAVSSCRNRSSALHLASSTYRVNDWFARSRVSQDRFEILRLVPQSRKKKLDADAGWIA